MIAVTTHSRTRSLRYTLPVLLAGKHIERELRDAPGCERYANVIAGPREFWTMTIWRDASQMRDWMRDGTHGQVMWQQPHWLECYWGMRWKPGRHSFGQWEGEPWQAAELDSSESSTATPPRALPAMPWMQAALGQTVPLERRQVAGAAGATYRLRVPPWELPLALADLRRLRRTASTDPDSFTLSLGLGTGRALYLLVIATSREALDRLRETPEHRRYLRRWGDRTWWSTWEPESEFGQWESHKLRDGQLVREPPLVDVTLPVQPSAACDARNVVRKEFEALDQTTLHALELLASELVGNSVRHGGLGPTDRIRLQIRARPGWIRVDVIDRGRRFEAHVPLSKSRNDGSGWGLVTVDKIADRWGIIDAAPERRVWFELRVPVAAPRPPRTSTRLDRIFTARPQELRRIRRALRQWMQQRAIPPHMQCDLLVAVGEVTANAVEHAYVGREPGEVYIEIIAEDDGVVARIRDFGHWRMPSPDRERRGLGIDMVRAVSDEFSCDTGPHGTTVAVRLRDRAR
jgi:anti-sigma regulatory factor (Ser/Thr protein kinase)